MQNLFIITGASRGIGKAIVYSLNNHFENNDNTFLLIARNRDRLKKIKNEIKGNVLTLQADLSDATNVAEVFERELTKIPEDFDRCVLINNAGIIRPIGFLGTLDNEKLTENITVNLIAPLLLTNSFLKVLKNSNCDKVVINISSGAGRMPIASWSAYCASKAGMDAFSMALSAENSNVFVYSVAPGIVETDMQKDIRSTPKEDFPLLDSFINLHKTGGLKTPEQCGEEIVRLIDRPIMRLETIVSF